MKQQVGTLEHDGETVYYEVTGEGEPVVLSHGAGGNHAICSSRSSYSLAGTKS